MNVQIEVLANVKHKRIHRMCKAIGPTSDRVTCMNAFHFVGVCTSRVWKISRTAGEGAQVKGCLLVSRRADSVVTRGVDVVTQMVQSHRGGSMRHRGQARIMGRAVHRCDTHYSGDLARSGFDSGAAEEFIL